MRSPAIIEIAELARRRFAMALEPIEHPIDRIVATKWCESSLSYRRTDHLFEDPAAGVGITPEEIDALWVWAAEL